MDIHTLSICTGTAGIELGLDIATGGLFKPVCYVEREAPAAENIAYHAANSDIPNAPIWSDVKSLCSFQFGDWLRTRLGGERLGAIVGGYPCQPFSAAGRRLGTKDERHLWPWIADAIGLYQPSICFFENVRGHVSMGFREVAEDLEAMGYTVAADVFSAAEVGCTHRRERLFILAVGNTTSTRFTERKNTRADSKDATEFESWRMQSQRASGVNVGNTNIFSSERRRTTKQQAEAGLADRHISIPDAPPGPDDRDGWRYIIERWPELAPAISNTNRHGRTRSKEQDGKPKKPELETPRRCDVKRRSEVKRQATSEPAIRGMAHVASNRVDRLRACGNAVVPLTAAAAFVQLFASIVGSVGE